MFCQRIVLTLLVAVFLVVGVACSGENIFRHVDVWLEGRGDNLYLVARNGEESEPVMIESFSVVDSEGDVLFSSDKYPDDWFPLHLAPSGRWEFYEENVDLSQEYVGTATLEHNGKMRSFTIHYEPTD